MKGKTLENLVLMFGLLVIGSAVFLMFIDTEGLVAKRVNLIFSVGFIIYILYSYLLSKNLNKEIRALNKIVANLKEEVARLLKTVNERDKTIATQKQNLAQLKSEFDAAQNALEEKDAALKSAHSKIAQLEEAAKQNEGK